MELFKKDASGLFVPADAAKARVCGHYSGVIIRGGYFDDNGVWVRGKNVIDRFEQDNICVDEGLNHMLDVTFHASTQVSTWYIGLFEGNYTPVSTDTAANITANSTECTAYTSSTRVAYVEAAAASKVTTNTANKADFVFNATKTIYGAFLVSASAKSATTGTLFSGTRFGSAKSVVSGDEMLLTYTVTLASA